MSRANMEVEGDVARFVDFLPTEPLVEPWQCPTCHWGFTYAVGHDEDDIATIIRAHVETEHEECMDCGPRGCRCEVDA